MDFAFEYIEKNGGVDSEKDYPYLMRDEKCDHTREKHFVAAIKSFVDVKKNSEEELAKAIQLGPVSIAIEADQRAFQHYKKGVFSKKCGTNLDHGVLLVGMGTEKDQDYWIVKNSWGPDWGESGYIRFLKGDPSLPPEGQCGILLSASYPVATTPPPTHAPVPTPKPSPHPGLDFYENPNTNGGCHADEMNGRIQGVEGSICLPKCQRKLVVFKYCPKAPDGYNAKAKCLIQESNGTQLCGLECDPSDPTSCNPDAQCNCRSIEGIGICTYDDPSTEENQTV